MYAQRGLVCVSWLFAAQGAIEQRAGIVLHRIVSHVARAEGTEDVVSPFPVMESISMTLACFSAHGVLHRSGSSRRHVNSSRSRLESGKLRARSTKRREFDVRSTMHSRHSFDARKRGFDAKHAHMRSLEAQARVGSAAETEQQSELSCWRAGRCHTSFCCPGVVVLRGFLEGKHHGDRPMRGVEGSCVCALSWEPLGGQLRAAPIGADRKSM